MSYQRLFLTAVAEILLAGEWSPQAMLARLIWLLQARPVWAMLLVSRIYQRFQDATALPGCAQLAAAIAADPKFVEIWQQYSGEMRIRRFHLEASPAPPARVDCQLPALENPKALAVWLGLSVGQLENYAAHWRLASAPTETRWRHYHYRWQARDGAAARLIEAPKARLAEAQRQIYLGILAQVPLHDACHGFRRRHSCQSYAAPHSGQALVLHMDLQNFFGSIPLRRIHALFVALGYRATVARRLAGLCCNQVPPDILAGNPQLNWQLRKQLAAPHLPQGAPSSPGLANLCAFNLDVRLAALAQKYGGRYTRYADDLAFSGGGQFARYARHLPALVAHIAADEGFSVNHRKTKLMPQSARQRLAGMSVNRFPNCLRSDYEQLKAILHNCRRFGAESQNRRQLPDFRAHLQGRVAWVKALNPAKGEKLEALLQAIEWPGFHA